MVSERWKKSKTVTYNINYHIIWCVKYRRKLLFDDRDIVGARNIYSKGMYSSSQSIHLSEITQLEVSV